MKKKLICIQSFGDVITNSSTELFTLKTDQGVDEVLEFLKANTTGFEKPEVLKKGEGVLEELRQYGYIIDPSDPEDLETYYIENIDRTEYFDYDSYRTCIIAGAREFYEGFLKYTILNIDKIAELTEKVSLNQEIKFECIHQLPYEVVADVSSELGDNLPDILKKVKFHEWCKPETFITDFIKSHDKETLPDNVVIHPQDIVDTYVGQIGFIGTDDNSIPGEDFEMINRKFNGTNWHLG